MAENDIYNSKAKYERIKNNLDQLLVPIQETKGIGRGQRKYYCKNPDNIRYFKKLCDKFEAQDLSYIRRYRQLQFLTIVVHNTTKDLKDVNRDDIDAIIAYTHTVMSPQSVEDFKIEVKTIWKKILPEKDEKGRIDGEIVPYPVRHLKYSLDKSKQVARRDRLAWSEFENLLNYFSSKPCIQAYLMVAFESLARPQELFKRMTMFERKIGKNRDIKLDK